MSDLDEVDSRSRRSARIRTGIPTITRLLESGTSLYDRLHTHCIVTAHFEILPDVLSDGSLFVVQRREGQTLVGPSSAWRPSGLGSSVGEALSDDNENSAISERILRGDFDA